MAAGSDQEKTEEATPKRKADARKKGNVARSPEVSSAFLLLVIALIGPYAFGLMGSGAIDAFRGAVGAASSDAGFGSLGRALQLGVSPILIGLAIIFGAVLIVGVLTNLAQVGFLFTAEPILPKFEKVNPLTGLKRIFSARGLVEGLKAAVKATLFGYIAYAAVVDRWPALVGLAQLPPIAAVSQVGGLIHTIVLRIGVIWLALAGLDYFFQRKQTDKQLRMSKDELKQEMKEQDGAPEVRMAREQRRRKLVRSRMADNVKTADVVVTNPTHFAVALKYDRSAMQAPVVVAKGQDYLALKLRELATQHKVPIVPNPPLARALYKNCEVGDFVPKDLFQAVAEVLAFVYRQLKR